jgi:hypothetical protein
VVASYLCINNSSCSKIQVYTYLYLSETILRILEDSTRQLLRKTAVNFVNLLGILGGQLGGVTNSVVGHVILSYVYCLAPDCRLLLNNLVNPTADRPQRRAVAHAGGFLAVSLNDSLASLLHRDLNLNAKPRCSEAS